MPTIKTVVAPKANPTVSTPKPASQDFGHGLAQGGDYPFPPLATTGGSGRLTGQEKVWTGSSKDANTPESNNPGVG